MTQPRLAFIDWMKCLGMFLIVYGHVAGGTINDLTPPLYPKQLGVAFFIFVLGYSLARETRPIGVVLFNRLFEMFLYGIAFALILSIGRFLTDGRLEASNYMPFVLGSNVLVDHFPANPTTWFIGTYLHVLLLWALVLRRVRIRAWLILLAIPVEITVRSLLMETCGRHVAYMALSNWMTLLLLGMWYGSKQAVLPRTGWWPLAGLAAGLVLLVTVYPSAVEALFGGPSFPYVNPARPGYAVAPAILSAAVTFVYLAHTWLVFQLTRRLPSLALVRLSARNTVLVFIVHMPLYTAIDPYIKQWTSSHAIWIVLRLLFCFVLLTLCSEVISRMLPIRRLRENLSGMLERWQLTRGARLCTSPSTDQTALVVRKRSGALIHSA